MKIFGLKYHGDGVAFMIIVKAETIIEALTLADAQPYPEKKAYDHAMFVVTDTSSKMIITTCPIPWNS